MTTPFKNPIKFFAPIFLMLMVVCLMGFGCNISKPTSDPLAGWQKAYGEEPNQMIVKDYQDYIQKLPPNQKGYIGTTWFYKNETGQHAVNIQIFEGNKNASWQHVLFYDKEAKRIKAIKYGYTRYQS